MTDEIKYLSVKDFHTLGFIQEINRRILHPCGLALSVAIEEDGTASFGPIWDYRDDPEGLYFGEGVMSRTKAKSVFDLFNSKVLQRKDTLGFVIQPIPEPVVVPEEDE